MSKEIEARSWKLVLTDGTIFNGDELQMPGDGTIVLIRISNSKIGRAYFVPEKNVLFAEALFDRDEWLEEDAKV